MENQLPADRNRGNRAASAAPALLRVVPEAPRPRLAQILIDQGAATTAEVNKALNLQGRRDLPIGEILMANGVISEDQLLAALARQYNTKVLCEGQAAVDPALAHLLPAKSAIALNAVPLRRVGPALVVATNRPDLGEEIAEAVNHDGPILLSISSRTWMQSRISDIYGAQLTRIAESRPPSTVSCRNWQPTRARRFWAGVIMLYCAALLLWPGPAIASVFAAAFVISGANSVLKILCLFTQIIADRRSTPDPFARAESTPSGKRLPTVTVLLPLFKEREIAAHLIRRIDRIDYPRDLLDVLLLIEADDLTTREALAETQLPPWMRAVIVPDGSPRTKPRALNYGLNFARGSIIGVYDAEDAPEPDQIRKVAEEFLTLPEDVVCLQGQLDYYNPTHNWLSRCFTLEYATWFRLLLPGVQRLGLFVPLGGTTLFFRRKPLEELGAWDAHNVTEDADLGLRLTRRGYSTRIISTTTFEEANSAILPWIKQRSRWLKGYALTWATHMRDPVQLWKDIGPKRFFGLQVQVLGAVFGFALAPLLWTLGVKMFGIAHPLDVYLAPAHYLLIGAYFVFVQILVIFAAWRAARLPRHRPLRLWIPLLDIYFLFASAASLLGLAELLIKPFHWRKTEHGLFSGQQQPIMPVQEAVQIEAASSLSRTSNAVER